MSRKPSRKPVVSKRGGARERGAAKRGARAGSAPTRGTERKTIEEARGGTPPSAEETLALLESALAAIPEPTVISRLGDGVYLRVNAAAANVLGYTPKEMLGSSALALGVWANPSERANVRAELLRNGSVLDRPVSLVARDGSVHRGLISASRIAVCKEPCAIFIFRDLTATVGAEERLLQSQTKYGAVFAAAADPIVVARRDDGVQLELNDAWVRMTRFTREQGLGRSALELGLWQNPGERARVIEQLATRGRVVGFPARFIRADGSPLDVLLSGVTVEIEGTACIVWSWNDVTEVRRMGREAEASRARLRALFDAAPDAMLIRSPEGRILEVNSALCRQTGYLEDELIGQSITLFLDRQDLVRRPLVSVGELRARGIVIAERLLQRKDGSTMHVEGHITLLPDGNVQILARDVTSQKLNEELVAHIARGVSATTGSEFYRTLCRQLSQALGADLVFIGEISDPDLARVRTLSVCSDAGESSNFEYPLAGSPCVHAVSRRGTICVPEAAAEQYPHDVGLRRRGISGYVGTSLHAADGTTLGILVAASRQPLTRPQLWTSVLEIFGARAAAEIERGHAETRLRELNLSLERRVSERTAELEAANRELESFAYSVSHDLRAPLRAIIGFIDILREEGAGELAPELLRHFARIEANASRMRELIDDLLAFSRVGREALKRERIDMNELVALVLNELGGRKSGVEIKVGELPSALADASLLRQVWINLIGNAMKFSAKTQYPRVEIDGRRNGDYIDYAVRDNGAGFDMRYADNLFRLFRRLHDATEFEGTGAGLAIVHRIVHRHGGKVAAQGEPGRGATFHFSLPA